MFLFINQHKGNTMKTIIKTIKLKIKKALEKEFPYDMGPEQFKTRLDSEADLTDVYKRIKLAIKLDVKAVMFYKYGVKVNEVLISKPQHDKLVALGYTVTPSECGDKLLVSGWTDGDPKHSYLNTKSE